MGVQWKDCGAVAELLGIKTFLNEFIAYEQLGKLIENRKLCQMPYMSVSIATWYCTSLQIYHISPVDGKFQNALFISINGIIA